jgi:hypothetical protein
VKRAGVSLIEVLVAAAILTAVGAAFLTALTHTAREMRATSDLSLSLFLAQKVVEDVIQAGHENAHASDALRELDGQRLPVTSLANPFFGVIEDVAAPYGKLVPGGDLGIDRRDPALHRHYGEFELTIRVSDRGVTALPGAPALLDEVRISYDSGGALAGSRSITLAIHVVKASIAPVPTPKIAQDLAGMDDAIRRVLYLNAPGSPDLVRFAAEAQADLAAVRDVGAIVVVSSYALSLMSALEAEITTLSAALPERGAASGGPVHVLADARATRSARPGGPGDAERHIAVAQLHERKAAAAWEALLYMRDPAARMSTSFRPPQLGRPAKVEPAFVLVSIAKARRLRAMFDHDTREALAHYTTARRLMMPLGARPFRQFVLERKVLELAKLAAMSGAGDLTFASSWIDALLAQYTGRNRAITDFLGRERRACRRLDDVRALHPQIHARLSTIDIAGTALAQLQRRVARNLLRSDEDEAAGSEEGDDDDD